MAGVVMWTLMLLVTVNVAEVGIVASTAWLARQNERRQRALMVSLGLDPEDPPTYEDVATDGGQDRSRLGRVLDWLKRRSAATEEATEDDGVLSYAGEWHALIIGLGTGFTAAVLGQPVVLAGLFAVALGISGVDVGVAHELRREPWYAVGGGLLAYVAMGGRLVEVAGSLPV